mmetsp:Transcript_12826/g.34980  ORF Transcript_12826/g.34980 Transcript_12826/m.34980 type:complete len:170 (-) Transcript_12826:86-595(-)
MLASRNFAPIRPAIRPGLSRGHSLLVTAAARKPSFHLQPPGGWTNDPNGVHYDAKTKLYHMFYQHHRTSSQWSWGLSWGHAVSEDLVHWSHLPPALDPTPEGPDAGGVWSGCAFPTDEGTVLLHTAVRKRDETPESKLPPAELDLGHQVIESQQYAVSQPEKDPFLRDW